MSAATITPPAATAPYLRAWIDAAKNSGIAFKRAGESELQSAWLPGTIGMLGIELQKMRRPGEKAVFLIEKPDTNEGGKGVQPARILANCAGDTVKAIWGSDATVVFVSSVEWHSAMLTGAPGDGWKEKSCFVAATIMPHRAFNPKTNHDEADAVCGFDYAERMGLFDGANHEGRQVRASGQTKRAKARRGQ